MASTYHTFITLSVAKVILIREKRPHRCGFVFFLCRDIVSFCFYTKTTTTMETLFLHGNAPSTSAGNYEMNLPSTTKKKRVTVMIVVIVLAALALDIDFLSQQTCCIRTDALSEEKSSSQEQDAPINAHLPLVDVELVHTIPHRLTFNYHTNLWRIDPSQIRGRSDRMFALNVQHTVRMFREAWNATLPQDGDDSGANMEVAYLVDSDCEAIINETEPRLFEAFQKERGSHKSDICRVVDLYQNGGYYCDNDLFVENVPTFAEHISFSTVLEANLERFFQAFTAASPQHPILREALDLMVAHYVDGIDARSMGYGTNNMGTWTMREAHKRAVTKNPTLSHQLYFLQEMNLEDHKSWNLGVEPDMAWRHYNHVAVDLQSNVLCFWARIGHALKERQSWH